MLKNVDCYKISYHRKPKFKTYYNLGNIDRQRKFILRKPNTILHVTVNGIRYLVCKTCFLNMLTIIDRITYTAISKLTNNGSV